jgi:hypothetical protein
VSRQKNEVGFRTKPHGDVSKLVFNRKTARWLRRVQMQGTEIEGEGAY